MDAPFKLACPNCGKEREYATEKSLERAALLKTTCASCRTARNNTKRKGTKSKENNPAWRGYGVVPGKVFSKLKRDAEKRDIPFEITIEDIANQYSKQNERCAFTGYKVLFGVDASVDRIDSSKGYTIGNIQIVHKTLNIMKRDIPNDEFISWCWSVYMHNYE